MSLFRQEMDFPDPNKPPIPEDENRVLTKLATKVVEKQMTAPAILFIESVKPLNFIGSQAMVFFEPIIQTVFNIRDYDTLRQALERRETLEILLLKIEHLDAIAYKREKRIKKWLKKERKSWKWYQRWLGVFTPKLVIPEEVLVSYDEAYRKDEALFGAEPDKILVDYHEQIPKSAPVLDVGSGQGRNAIFLAEQGHKVIGIDPSAVAVKTVRKIAEERSLKIECVQKGLATYETDQKFSAILLLGFLQILRRENIVATVGRCRELLMPGGLIFVTAFGVEDPSYDVWSTTRKLDENSFQKDTGDIRTFLERDEVLSIFNFFDTVHHSEQLGPEHTHGEGEPERHFMIEAVFKR